MTGLDAMRREFVRVLLATSPKGKRSTFGQLLGQRGLPAVAEKHTGRAGLTRWVAQLLGAPLPGWVMAAVLDVTECWQELAPGHPWRQEGRAVFVQLLDGPAAMVVTDEPQAPAPRPPATPPATAGTWRPPAFPSYSPGEDHRRRLREIQRQVRAEWLQHVAETEGTSEHPHLLSRRHLEWTAAHLLGHGVRAIARQHGVTPAAVSLAVKDVRQLLGLPAATPREKRASRMPQNRRTSTR